MPYEFGELLDGTVLYSRFTEEISDSLLLDYVVEQGKRGFFGKYRAELVDGRDVQHHTSTKAGLDQLTELAREVEHLLRGRRVAMVAADDLTFGMFRMWELRREDIDYEVRVFWDFEEGLRWLKESLPQSPE